MYTIGEGKSFHPPEKIFQKEKPPRFRDGFPTAVQRSM